MRACPATPAPADATGERKGRIRLAIDRNQADAFDRLRALVAQADFLVKHRCDVLQGFLFARPMGIESVANYTTKRLWAGRPPVDNVVRFTVGPK